MTRTVLFLCTGNYYRSRFAEYLFNALAEQQGLAWRARSRALTTATGPWKVGPISHYAVDGLRARGVRLPEFVREPLLCCDDDLCSSHLTIALKEAEHRPRLRKHFPHHCDRVEYWHIHDIDVAHPEQALSELDELVRQLVDRLRTESPNGA